MVTQVVIIGTGGHARVVASEIIKSKKYNLLGFIDDNNNKNFFLDYRKKKFRYIGCLKKIRKLQNNKIGFICAIGDLNLRYKIVSNIIKNYPELNWINVISKHSIVDETLIIGKGNIIIAGSTINLNSKIGNHTIVNTNCSIDHDCIIGNFVNISPGVNIAGSVEIYDKCFIGMNSSIKEKIIIRKNVIIGANSFVNINCKENKKYFGIPIKKIND
jgi:sugar O-acyltransferase (sialic acid O-acetyltransferase NeuD family)